MANILPFHGVSYALTQHIQKKINCEQTKAQFLACKDKNTIQLDREPLSDSNS